MEEEKENRLNISSQTKWNIVIISTMVVLAIFLIKPLITSYSTISSEGEYIEKITELNQDLVAAQTSLEENQKFKEELFEENKKLNSNLLSCREELATSKSKIENLNENIFSLKKDISDVETRKIQKLEEEKTELSNKLEGEKAELSSKLEGEKEELSNEIDELETELNNLQSNYDNFARNLANSICCKQKIDKWEINYYSIINNNLLCLEEGDKEISCPFG